MRAVIQRVRNSNVSVDQKMIGTINQGLTILVGIEADDTMTDLAYIENKILNLRIFEDQDGKMNRSIQDIGGELLLISQFTLYGDARKGNRPSFIKAAGYEQGKALYDELCERIKNSGLKTAFGEYGADMLVLIENDGPVTILLDSNKVF